MLDDHQEDVQDIDIEEQDSEEECLYRTEVQEAMDEQHKQQAKLDGSLTAVSFLIELQCVGYNDMQQKTRETARRRFYQEESTTIDVPYMDSDWTNGLEELQHGLQTLQQITLQVQQALSQGQDHMQQAKEQAAYVRSVLVGIQDDGEKQRIEQISIAGIERLRIQEQRLELYQRDVQGIQNAILRVQAPIEAWQRELLPASEEDTSSSSSIEEDTQDSQGERPTTSPAHLLLAEAMCETGASTSTLIPIGQEKGRGFPVFSQEVGSSTSEETVSPSSNPFGGKRSMRESDLLSSDSDPSGYSSKEGSEPQTKRRKVVVSMPSIETQGEDAEHGESLLTSGSFFRGHLDSLQGLQHIFSHTTTDVARRLRAQMLCIDGYIPNTLIPTRHNGSMLGPCCIPSEKRKTVPTAERLFPKRNTLQGTYRPHPTGSSFIPFGCSDRSVSDRTSNNSSTGIGLLGTIYPRLIVGAAYDQKSIHVAAPTPVSIEQRSSCGSTTCITKTKEIASMVAWNRRLSGVTGYLAGCYGWGTIQPVRTIYTKNPFENKGKTSIRLAGALVQLGYTVSLLESSITPYFETTYLHSRWSPYNERSSGMVSCRMSKNIQSVWDTSIGIRSFCESKTTSRLQTWMAIHAMQQRLSQLQAAYMALTNKGYTLSIPASTRKNTYVACGCLYTVYLLDTLTINIHTTCRIDKQSLHQTAELVVRYAY